MTLKLLCTSAVTSHKKWNKSCSALSINWHNTSSQFNTRKQIHLWHLLHLWFIQHCFSEQHLFFLCFCVRSALISTALLFNILSSVKMAFIGPETATQHKEGWRLLCNDLAKQIMHKKHTEVTLRRSTDGDVKDFLVVYLWAQMISSYQTLY